MISLKKQISKNKEILLDSIIIISILGLGLLPITPAHYHNSNHSLYLHIGSNLRSISTSIMEEPIFSLAGFISYNQLHLQKIEQYVDLVYISGGIGVAALTLLIYRQLVSKEQELNKYPLKDLYSQKIWKIASLEEINKEKTDVTRIRILILIPVAFIALAELLLFLGRTELAIWIHIGVLIVLILSNLFLKDLKIYRVYQGLMLLPILRLVNLSMPVFFTTTLYTFVFIYGSLLIPLVIIVMRQRNAFKKKAISIKNFLACIILSVYMSFLLGLREYMTLRPSYLIPNISFENLLILIFVMVFLVGLVEEIIFRSILQTRLEETLGIEEALIITSLLFGLMHSGYGNFYEIFYASFAGTIIGYSFYKTRNLLFAVLAHGFANVFLFGLLPHYISNWVWV